jgi:hypothetical protein
MVAQQSLTNLQLELLKVFSRPVSDDDLNAIRNMLSVYFAKKAMDLADDAWAENGWSAKDTNKLMNQHNRIAHESSN